MSVIPKKKLKKKRSQSYIQIEIIKSKISMVRMEIERGKYKPDSPIITLLISIVHYQDFCFIKQSRAKTKTNKQNTGGILVE